MDIVAAILIGLAGGMLGGVVGVGGGVLFVPGLVLFLGLSQLDAVATSLLAIVFVGAVGAWRQDSYGNVRWKDALLLGVLSPIGVVVGVVVANHIGERPLELSFAALQLVFAAQLLRRTVDSAR